MRLDELKYGVCNKCGEVHPIGEGIWAMLQRPCNSNRYTYKMYVGSGFLKIFNAAIAGLYEEQTDNPMTPFQNLLNFPYFQPMPDFDTASDFEKKCYHWCREAEIKHMKRLRLLVEAEQEFYYSY